MVHSGEMYFYSLSPDLGSVDVSMTGANYSWDYSGISYSSQDTMQVVSVSSTPIAYQLYFNNPFSSAYYADHAVKGQDFDAFGQITITDRFDFYKLKSSSLEIVGFGANINGLPMSVKYDTIDQIYPLPMTYGTNDSTSAYYLISIPNLGTYGQWIRRKVEVDGWGAISTPFASYNNTIRVRTTLYQRDTIYVDQIMFGNNFDRPVENIYEWFEVANGAPVFKVVERGGVITEILYLDEIHINNTSIGENNLEELVLFPNPATESILLNVSGKFSYKVMDLYGRILQTNMNQTSNQIDIQNLPVGCYLIKIEQHYNSKYHQFIKE